MIGSYALLVWLAFPFLNVGSCFLIEGELNVYGFSPYPSDRSTAITTLTFGDKVHEPGDTTADIFTQESASSSRTMSVAYPTSSTYPSPSIGIASTPAGHSVAITLTKRPTLHWTHNKTGITPAQSPTKYFSSITPTLTMSKEKTSTPEVSHITSSPWQGQSTPTAITTLSNNAMLASNADGSRPLPLLSVVIVFGFNLLLAGLL